jgi:hypothetical protein
MTHSATAARVRPNPALRRLSAGLETTDTPHKSRPRPASRRGEITHSVTATRVRPNPALRRLSAGLETTDTPHKNRPRPASRRAMCLTPSQQPVFAQSGFTSVERRFGNYRHATKKNRPHPASRRGEMTYSVTATRVRPKPALRRLSAGLETTDTPQKNVPARLHAGGTRV